MNEQAVYQPGTVESPQHVHSFQPGGEGPPESQVLAIATDLLARGLSIIPVEFRGKRPSVEWKQYQGLKPTDAEIRGWFGGGRSNLGIVTGKVSQVVAVDCDSPEAVAWANSHLPPTPMVTKTAKGEHRFFRHPDQPVRNRARINTGDAGVKLDVRGDGGFVVAPGSIHETGTVYQRVGSWPPAADLPVFDPAWLTDVRAKNARAASDHALGQRQEESLAARMERARTYLSRVPPATQGEGGDTHTFNVCCRLVRGFDLPDENAFEILEPWNAGCTPPWSDAELRAKIRGAREYGTEPVGGRLKEAPPPNSPAVESRTLKLTAASEITIRPVKWLWHERTALGTVSLLGGREGVGKTILIYTLAADITRGRLPGAYFGTPRGVILAATEDSWEHTIVPRLMAAGADLTRIYRVDVVSENGIGTAVSLPKDLVELERVIRQTDAALVILDPLLSRLDAALDTHKDAEVRQAMEPLVTLANSTNTSIIGLIHVNKGASSDALTMLMGSRAFAAVARSVCFVMADPDDEGRRLLGTPKNNLGRTDLPTLSFRIVGVKVADTPEGEVWTGKLEWLGESDRSIASAIETTSVGAVNRTVTIEAADWLTDYLAGQDGPADSATVKREGQKAGHSKDALHRACQRLGVQTESSGFPRRTFWLLPSSYRSLGRIKTTATTATTATTGQEQGEAYRRERG